MLLLSVRSHPRRSTLHFGTVGVFLSSLLSGFISTQFWISGLCFGWIEFLRTTFKNVWISRDNIDYSQKTEIEIDFILVPSCLPCLSVITIATGSCAMIRHRFPLKIHDFAMSRKKIVKTESGNVKHICASQLVVYSR